MTLRVGNPCHDEFNLSYIPILRESGESVGTAYDHETAALFAAAPDLLAACEDVFTLITPRHTATPEAWKERQEIADRLPGRLRAAIQKAKGEKL